MITAMDALFYSALNLSEINLARRMRRATDGVSLSTEASQKFDVRRFEVARLLSIYLDKVRGAELTRRPAAVGFEVAHMIEEQEDVAGAAAKDPLAAARARGRDRAMEILKRPEMLPTADFGRLLGVSHEAVRACRHRHEVLGLEGTKRGVRYPRWQLIDDQRPLPGLADLYSVLNDNDWAIYRFLLQRHAELGGRTALEALKAGDVDTVHEVAKSIASGAFS